MVYDEEIYPGELTCRIRRLQGTGKALNFVESTRRKCSFKDLIDALYPARHSLTYNETELVELWMGILLFGPRGGASLLSLCMYGYLYLSHAIDNLIHTPSGDFNLKAPMTLIVIYYTQNELIHRPT